MSPEVHEWLAYFTRWAHLIAGISWIGNSFYFMWLDSHLEPPKPAQKGSNGEGVEGSLWMVHSGGFYQVEKRKIRPHEVPPTLHWFYWEATLTWITGFLLLAIIYYWRADAFLIDTAVLALTPMKAIGLSLTMLAGSWLVYDVLWQSALGQKKGASTLVSGGLLTALGFGLCHVFSGRGAFIHLGAILGTIMVLNVWVRILPAQQKMIDATQRGDLPDYELGKKAKTRSVHNSYLTLPVLFTMLANHHAGTFAHPKNWLVLVALIGLGMSVRHIMILRLQTKPTASGYALAGLSLLALVALVVAGNSPRTQAANPANYESVRTIVAARCVSCHSAKPTDEIYKTAPKGVVFDTPEILRAHSQMIRLMVVQTKAMPLANKTQMTDEERAIMGSWIDRGAPGP